MQKMKLVTVFLSVMLLMLPVSTNSLMVSAETSVDEHGFNEYGMKESANMTLNQVSMMSAASNWETFAPQHNVPLEKVWTVKFSSAVSLSQIDAIVIERNGAFIPVSINVNIHGNECTISFDAIVIERNGAFIPVNINVNAHWNECTISFDAIVIERNGAFIPVNINVNAHWNECTISFDAIVIERNGAFIPVNINVNAHWNECTISFDAIVIERNGAFIPVNINVNAQNEIQVSPADRFIGNSKYEMKVFLENGKKYNMDFTTVSESRNADIESNNTYIHASKLYLNESISGALSKDDQNDYYKIELPADGKLELTATQLNGGEVDLYLYGVGGSDDYDIASTYNKTTATLSTGLSKGTYYLRVNYSGHYGNYTLENKFTENTVENDHGTASYVTANEFKLNHTMTGHIGYIFDDRSENRNDYYKLVVPEDGRLVLKAKQLHGGELNMYLYGKLGNDGYPIREKYNQAGPIIDVGLAAGTYYVRVNDSGYYGAYELTNDFYASEIDNDKAPSSYILADSMPVNGTVYGHIGYTYENTGYNQNDYYKIEVPRSGKIDITATQLDGKELDLYLYGSHGTDGYAIETLYNRKMATIAKELSPGTYYIRINDSGYYGGYKLTTKFAE
ncbi:PPC domain-containing protein [Bacillus sp. FJAT-42315]|uniref:PPC domain-containing protein n=1 Tax=Bacillus sp. FJAT-42315 TaxID=2014077 RepID=UPI000C236554|nr:PPC domain-containing protein [Bacillus sp. FJAT-42315]